jgi:hypothetical protein
VVSSSAIALAWGRSGRVVEFGDNEGVTVSAGCQCLAQSWSFAVAAGQSVVDVDPVWRDAQCCQALALDGEVLFVGGTPGLTDEKRRHDAPPMRGRPEANVARSPAAARNRYIQSSGNDHQTQEGKGAF